MKIKIKTDKHLYSHDLDTTVNFYDEYFGILPTSRNEDCILYESGLQFRRVSPWVAYIAEKEHRITRGNRTAEIVFETGSAYKNLQRLHDENCRVIVPESEESPHYYRLYDPDNHIIEVRESSR